MQIAAELGVTAMILEQRNRRDIGGEVTHARHAGLWSWLAAISAAAGV